MLDCKILKKIPRRQLIISAIVLGILLTTFLVYCFQFLTPFSWGELVGGSQYRPGGIIENKDTKLIQSSLSQQLLKAEDRIFIDFYLNEKKFQFELVNTAGSRTQGLSGRQKIGTDGMLFVFFESGYHGIWMKEMEFDLDLIWLDESGKIIDLDLLLPAPKTANLNDLPVYQPSLPASMVLEVPAGFVQKHQIQVGQFIEKAN